MSHVFYLNRKTQKVEEEKIYGLLGLKLLYEKKIFYSLFSKILLHFCVKNSFVSRLCAFLHKTKKSQKKIAPFIRAYEINIEEFVVPPEGFSSFNDFFIRKLKPGARPLKESEKTLVLPADGRYLVFENVSHSDTFFVKGQQLSLQELIPDPAISHRYEEGSLVFGRLCPSDYHRFHFPCDCIPSRAQVINGYLYSVNPIALRQNIKILSQNKRVLTELETTHFGKVLYIEVGATAVGSIQQTYTPHLHYKKGDEKGFFEFGGSTVLMLFEKNKIIFDKDLLESSKQCLEVKANMGESLGQSFSL